MQEPLTEGQQSKCEKSEKESVKSAELTAKVS